MIAMRTRTAHGLGAVLAGAALAGATALLALAGAAGPARASSAHATPGPRSVMILLDTNRSMARALPAERAAVVTYARALPPDVRAGLITFSNGWRLVLGPTANRGRLAAAVAAIHPAGGTSNGIYAALEAAGAAVNRLHAAARSRLVVISDAEDLTSGVPTATLPADVVIWHRDGDDRAHELRVFAQADHGQVASPATAASLAAAFPPSAPARPPAGQRAGQPAPAVHPGRAEGTRLPGTLIAALATVFAALFLMPLLVIDLLRRHYLRRGLTERIERYGPQHAPASTGSDRNVASAAVGWMRRLLRSSNAEPQLAKRLDLAGIDRQPAEWALLGVCASAALAAALTVLSRNPVVGVLAGALTGWLGMRLALSFRIGRRRAAFSEQLPDVLQLVAGSLQSGFSLEQSLDAVVREGAQPAAGEFSRALAEARIGADMEDALDGVANRMDSSDLQWTVMAVRIQRTVGGNLAEVLRNIVGTMRERAYLRRQVRALSAEGRLSAYIIVALPVVIGGLLFLKDPAYMRPLYTTPAGLVMLAGAVILVVLGALWMRALIKVEV